MAHWEDAMKRMLVMALMVLYAFFLTACSTPDAQSRLYEITPVQPKPSQNAGTADQAELSDLYLDFEQTLLTSTDVVVASFVGQRHFGENLTEIEFNVADRVLGNAADTIFVYFDNATPFGGTGDALHTQGILTLERETRYLLVLDRLQGATLKTHEDGFTFINNLIINLDNPALSTINNEPLSNHSSQLDFYSESLLENSIISFVKDIAANNPPARERIRSDSFSDIIINSPYIFIVEVNEPRRLVSAQVTRDWMETDIYFCTIAEVIKGDVDINLEISVVFFADTVRTGEQYIVAVERISEGSTTFEITSANSLFIMSQLDEVMSIVE